MSLGTLGRWPAVGLLLLAECLAASTPVTGQQAVARKIKTQVAPTYPELARRMNISGTVRLQVRVDKSGTVKETKLVGGHPVLANAAMDAIRRWKYEPGPEETVGMVEFRFDPNQ